MIALGAADTNDADRGTVDANGSGEVLNHDSEGAEQVRSGRGRRRLDRVAALDGASVALTARSELEDAVTVVVTVSVFVVVTVTGGIPPALVIARSAEMAKRVCLLEIMVRDQWLIGNESRGRKRHLL